MSSRPRRRRTTSDVADAAVAVLGAAAAAPSGSESEPASDRESAAEPPAPFEPASRLRRALVLALVILLPQVLIFFPSLTGSKALLPLDVLATRSVWIAPGEPGHLDASSDEMLSDLVLVTEMNRRLSAEAVRAGRFPLWTPDTYCGAPYFAANHPALLSPYRCIDYAWPGVEAVAWSQLVKALVAGLGTYWFARRVLRASFLPAVAGAAAFPLCGYMVLWQGFSLSQVASWLPWMLWAADAAARRPFGAGGLGLALATCALLVSGHAANAGHVLLAAGAWGAWAAFDRPERSARAVAASLVSVAAGFVLGFALSAPQLLPTLEYMQQSARIAARAAGQVETPTLGWEGLMQLVFPYALGSSERGALMLSHVPRSESAAAAYAGLLALVLLTPLGFGDARRRGAVIFLAACGAFALVPLLGVPVLEGVFHVPPLSLLRNNRFTVLTAFVIVVVATVGLDELVRGRVRPRGWHVVPLVVVAGLVAWNVVGLVAPPGLEGDAGVSDWFRRTYRIGLLVSLAALGGWLLLRRATDPARHARLALVAAFALLIELTVQAYGANPQVDRRYEYPRLAVLDEVARRDPHHTGRVLGLNCLPPNLLRVHGLWDVRGYDAADPARIVDLLRAQRDPEAPEELPYAVTLLHVPKHPSPISDLLALRWIVLPGDPPPGVRVAWVGGGYSLFENQRASPRATIPARVDVEPDAERRLARLAADDFDPRALALVEEPLARALSAPAEGRATIRVDEPEHVVIDLELATDALVVLADAYDAGWRAFVDGVEARVHVVDHALRGVEAARGARVLEFRYEPASLRIGLWIGGVALVSMIAWALVLGRRATPAAT